MGSLNFGLQLRKLREYRNLSQEELANILNTSKQVLSRYETGQRIPKITTVDDYSNLLGVDISYFLHNDSPDNATKNLNKESSFTEKKLSDQEQQLIDDFRQLNTDGQDKVLEYTDDLVSSGKYIKNNFTLQEKEA